MREYRVGVVGCGVGKIHVEAWSKLPGRFKVQAVCDLKREAGEKVAQEFGVPDILTDFAALLARPDIDVIDICTPSSTHVALAEQALALGKHVVLEKPMAGSLAEADRLIAAANRARGRLMPIFQYRYGNGVRKLKQLIANGVTGRL